MNYICFYHSPCNDGEMAKNIWKLKHPKTVFFPWIHSNENDNLKFLNIFEKEHIVFLDYCPKKEYLNNKNKYLIIDHHQNAINNIVENDNIKLYCDIKRSGCMLTWDYLFPNTPYPISVFHIGNADIFNFSDKETEAFSLFYKNFNLSPNELLNLKKDDGIYEKIIIGGVNLIAKYKITALTYFYIYKTEYEYINSNKYKVLLINCDQYNLNKYLIEIAKINFEDYNILKIKRKKGDKIYYSLRSLDGTPVDILARKYGGNGHPMAAGYTLIK